MTVAASSSETVTGHALPPGRVVAIVDDYPWPPMSGRRRRLVNIVEALASVSRVALVLAVPGANGKPAFDLAGYQRVVDAHRGPDGRVSVAAVALMGAPLPMTLRRLVPWLASGLPRRVAIRDDWGDLDPVRALVSDPACDVVVCANVDLAHLLSDSVANRFIIDVDDLEHVKLAARLALPDAEPPAGEPSLRERLHDRARRLLASRDMRRWEQHYRRLAGRAEALLVCSELDQRRLGTPNAVVIPNSYDPVEQLAPPPGRGVLAMTGTFAYEPNLDAARFLVCEIAPLLRRTHPDVEIRLIGQPAPGLADLARHPGVRCIGPVEDMGVELAECDVATVPVRYGSGTRVKALEALAYGRPIVATHLGVEGLGLSPGVHVLLADDAAGFAEACRRLLDEPSLAAGMVQAGRRLWAERFDARSVRAALAQYVLSGSTSATGP